jgi:hypothetical protein
MRPTVVMVVVTLDYKPFTVTDLTRNEDLEQLAVTNALALGGEGPGRVRRKKHAIVVCQQRHSISMFVDNKEIAGFWGR